jgi:hypothetical protein
MGRARLKLWLPQFALQSRDGEVSALCRLSVKVSRLPTDLTRGIANLNRLLRTSTDRH